MAIDMLKYYCYHRPLFDSNYQPFFISLMKLLGAWFTEIMNIILICRQDKIMDAVMNFIALGVIAEIDNLYAARLFQLSCFKVLEEENLPFIEKRGPLSENPSIWTRF